VLYAVCAVYALVGTTFFLGDYARRVLEERAVVGAVEQARPLLADKARVGVVAGSGIQYVLADHQVINLNGVTQRFPGVSWGNVATQVEILRRHPALRPDVWFLDDSERGELAAAGLVGPVLFSVPALLGAESHASFQEATCGILDAGRTPLTSAALQAVRGLRLVDEMEPGSPEQETSHDYRRFNRSAGIRLAASVISATLQGQQIVETGYPILGDEEFDVTCAGGRDLWVVARTSLRLTAISVLGPHRRERVEIALTPPVRVGVSINGEPVPLEPGVLTPSTDHLDEKAFRIPARYVTTPLRIRMAGDHIACHYWFYQ